MPHLIDTVDGAVDLILDTLPETIVMGLPLGIGKPNVLVNSLYRRIKDNPNRRLHIFTALSLERPVGGSDLERRFLAPFVDRVFGNYPDLDQSVQIIGQMFGPQAAQAFVNTFAASLQQQQTANDQQQGPPQAA